MKHFLRRHHISFQHAIEGILWAVKTQPNFIVHLIISLCVLLAASFFRISAIETTILVFTILLGLMAEMINTALESMTDLITTEWKTQAKVAKDVSAGMMLLVATGAVIIAGLIFIPYIYAFLTTG